MQALLNNPTWAEDNKLVDGLVHHHPEAMASLYQRYSMALKSVIMKVLHDEAETEDVLQEVFLQVWDRAINYSPKKGHTNSLN